MTSATLPRVSVVGLGKLGAPLAAVLASRGFSVIGLDVNKTFVDAMNAGKMPIVEPQLNELIAANRERLSATMDANEAIQKSDASFVIVPTPSDSTGFFSNRFVLQAMETLGKALQGNKKGYHMVVITSTVMPGTTDTEIKAALEAASGRKVGPDLGLCYNPEFIALGSVVRDMLFPDSILIGESDSKAGDMLQTIYLQMCEKKPPVQRMNFVNAELTKISVNTYVTTKISYANMLADICDRMPGADVDVVTKALGADTRIGAEVPQGRDGLWRPLLPARQRGVSPRSPASSAPAPTWPRRPTASTTSRSSACRTWSRSSPRPARASPCSACPTSRRRPWWRKATASSSPPSSPTQATSWSCTIRWRRTRRLAVLGDKVVGASSIEGAVRECDLLIVATGWPRVQGHRSGLVQARRPAPHRARPLAHPAGRQVRGGCGHPVPRVRPLETAGTSSGCKSPRFRGLFHARHWQQKTNLAQTNDAPTAVPSRNHQA